MSKLTENTDYSDTTLFSDFSKNNFKLDLKEEICETDTAEIDEKYEIQKCSKWIKENGFQKVCLQFPDHLLPDSSDVALKLQDILEQTVYILGDTEYESCCIDYVAAAHIDADAVIHFGPICFSKTSANIPYLNIYQKRPIELEKFKCAFEQTFSNKEENITLVVDDGYIHSYDRICQIVRDNDKHSVHRIDDATLNLSNKVVLFIGSNERKLMNIDLNFRPKNLYNYDPKINPMEITAYKTDDKILKRRYFLMEKIRDANTIGIVISTLGVKNYLTVIERMKKLIDLCGKKYYLISVGKPTVAKLANIGEIDVYVVIACSMNKIYESRDFYKPIVTPYDVEMALNFMKLISTGAQFSYDYNRYLNIFEDITSFSPCENETDVSLLTGKLRRNRNKSETHDETGTENSTDAQIALKADGTVAVNSNFGAGYLSERSWKGLEQNLGQTEVKLAEEGRKGTARAYDNEKY